MYFPGLTERMRFGFTSLLLTTLIATSGCVQMHPTRSGFLTDYSQLVKDKKDHVRANPIDPVALAQIDSFYVEPVVWLADDMGQPASNPKNEEKLRNSLEMALVTQLSEIRPVVDELGPRTARVRSAVTAVQESQPLANAFLAVQIAGPLFNGGAVAEIEIIGPQGEQIAAQSAAYRGWDWDVLGYFWKPSHPKTALKRGVKQLAKELQAANVQQPSYGAMPLQTAREPSDGGGESGKDSQPRR